MIKNKKITLKNIIVWNKGDTRGQHSRNTRMYAVADEKCLFIMKGNQESSINAVNYDYRFESIREYLYNSRVAMGWDIATMKNIVGHSDKSRDHWTSKSQWNMPSREVYDKLQKEAFNQKKEKSLSNNAFCRSYDDLLKEYESKRAYCIWKMLLLFAKTQKPGDYETARFRFRRGIKGDNEAERQKFYRCRLRAREHRRRCLCQKNTVNGCIY